MPNESCSLSLRRERREIQREIVSGLMRLDLSNNINLDRMIAIGGYADVFVGTLSVRGVKVRVAVKKFRCMLEKEKEFAQAFARELCLWAHLKHHNVLSLIGMTVIDGMPGLASEWMENGTMNDYLKKHEEVDILELVKGIACGLEYLHDIDVVHADLKGDNVLIAHDGRPVLSDFGVSRLLINNETFVGTTSIKGNMRWMAPELIMPEEGSDPEHSCQTKASDVWAFGMVTYEALSGKRPFYSIQNEGRVVMVIISGNKPAKPEQTRTSRRSLDILWDCCCKCWIHDAESRPSMNIIKEDLNYEGLLAVEEIYRAPASKCWVSPTGRFLAAKSDSDRSVSFWTTHEMVPLERDLKIKSVVCEIAWSSSEERICTISEDGILQEWIDIFDLSKLVAVSTQTHGEATLEYSSDDRLIATASMGTAKLWDASNLALIWENSGFWCRAITFHPTGQKFFNFDKYNFYEVNTQDLNNIKSTVHKLDNEFHRIVFDPMGITCAIQTNQVVKILDANTFKERVLLPYSGCVALRYTPDGKYILLVLNSKKLVLWDVMTGHAAEESSLGLGKDVVWNVEVSKNCRAIHLHASGKSYLVRLLLSPKM